MLEIAKKHQVLCVTHLPTIAAIGGDITEYSIMNAKELREERKGI